MAQAKPDRNWITDNASNQKITWSKDVPDTILQKFEEKIEDKYNLKFVDYFMFHEWSVANFEIFWEEIWHYFGVIASKPYDEVLRKTGKGFLDNDWFSGARLNFAENILRCRNDNIALIYLNEFGTEERFSYFQVFEEVKLYAAAFRKNGLEKDDTVACYMSNITETIFAMLAVTSIGAIWGGPLPYYGAQAAANLMQTMEPKFLIAVDTLYSNGVRHPMLDNVAIIVEKVESIEKVILVRCDGTTRKEDIARIRNCVLLHDFLKDGRNSKGKVPDLKFEQLPLNHPISLNFVSGASGQPKVPVHSAATLLSHMRDYGLCYNMKKGDVLLSFYPVGWSIWDYYLPSLAMEMPLVLLNGSPYYKINGMNFWDILAKYRVKLVFLLTSIVDKMEEMQIYPSEDSDLEAMQIIGIGPTNVKEENIRYLLNNVKTDAVITNMYGSTEVYGTFSGLDLNMPIYGCEIQVPGLGMDIQCLDSEGNVLIGHRGELVVGKPAPNLPVYLWKDVRNERLTRTYLTKFPGKWSQNDECWTNPQTKGMMIIGRSDDILNPKGEAFTAEDIYFAIRGIEELEDYICVSQPRFNGDSRVVLFLKLKESYQLTDQLRANIERTIDQELCTGYCVPEIIMKVPDIPYNLDNKKLESVVRKILEDNEIPEVPNILNPECLQHYMNIPEILSYNQPSNV